LIILSLGRKVGNIEWLLPKYLPMSKNNIWSFIMSIEVVICYKINAQHNWNQHTSKYEPSENLDLNWKVRKNSHMSKTSTQVKMNSCATIRTQVQRTNTEWSQNLSRTWAQSINMKWCQNFTIVLYTLIVPMGSHNIEDEIPNTFLKDKTPKQENVSSFNCIKVILKHGPKSRL
jgi:hypothetical protein